MEIATNAKHLYDVLETGTMSENPVFVVEKGKEDEFFALPVSGPSEIQHFMDGIPRRTFQTVTFLFKDAYEASGALPLVAPYVKGYFRTLSPSTRVAVAVKLKENKRCPVVSFQGKFIFVHTAVTYRIGGIPVRTLIFYTLHTLAGVSDTEVWPFVDIDHLPLDPESTKFVDTTGVITQFKCRHVNIYTGDGVQDMSLLVMCIGRLFASATVISLIEAYNQDENATYTARDYKKEKTLHTGLRIMPNPKVKCSELHVNFPDFSVIKFRLIQWLFDGLQKIGFTQIECHGDEECGWKPEDACQFFAGIAWLYKQSKRTSQLIIDVSHFEMDTKQVGLMMRVLIERKCWRWVRLFCARSYSEGRRLTTKVNEWFDVLVQNEDSGWKDVKATGRMPPGLTHLANTRMQIVALNQKIEKYGRMPYGQCTDAEHEWDDKAKRQQTMFVRQYHQALEDRAEFFKVSATRDNANGYQYDPTANEEEIETNMSLDDSDFEWIFDQLNSD